MDTELNKKLYQFYEQFLTDERRETFDFVLSNRTKFLTVVLEDIFQSQNASAVLRSCDALGVQDVHIIENSHEYTLNPGVTKGCSKWLDLHKYNEEKDNTLACINNLKEKGYKIVATTPHEEDCTIEEYEFDSKTAIVFGTELTGVSQTVIDNADAFVKIPMVGFSESFNISVSAAICIHTLMNKLRKSNHDWDLSEEDFALLKVDWAEKTIKKPDLLRKEFLSKIEKV
jgi:tRNA (guanosine-2'-O-)-methyltransferase